MRKISYKIHFLAAFFQLLSHFSILFIRFFKPKCFIEILLDGMYQPLKVWHWIMPTLIEHEINKRYISKRHLKKNDVSSNEI